MSDSNHFLVVGLGGSAGAIAAFREFFQNVPADSGMAYVVILHLSPDHESRLAEVLQSSSAIPVVQVRENLRLEPNRAYVISPSSSLVVRDGMLLVDTRIPAVGRRAPVDLFFRTLADSHDAHAVAVVMSGTGADGSMGLRRMKEYGGLVLAQTPKQAEFDEMPRSAIATGLVDDVIAAGEMPQRIMRYRDQIEELRTEPVAGDEEEEAAEERALVEILMQLRVRTGHDFTNYKRPTVVRRIQRRIALNELAGFAAYSRFMRENAAEAELLVKELLISVTNFFRDSEVFDALEAEVIPKLFAGKGAEDHIRAWVAGCATGEEAYSLAMLLEEAGSTLAFQPAIQVFATDLDEKAIARAREAVYNEAEVADVSPERLRRFFNREQNGYRIRRELRELVLFANHNLIKDPPFSHLQIVSCRNLLIYLNRSAQQRALEVIHFALEPEGYLLLGPSESAEGASNLYRTVDKEKKIYQARDVGRTVVITQSRFVPSNATDVRSARARGVIDQSAGDLVRARMSSLDLHQKLLEQVAPPSIVIDEEHDIVHLSDSAGRYLEVRGGEPSSNLLQLARPELRADLRTAVYQARQSRTAVQTRAIDVRTAQGKETVRALIRPVASESDPLHGLFLVIIEPVGRSESAPPETVAAGEPVARQVEEELSRLKAQTRVTVEQYETQAEEFKAANEELQAMNEELRSTAEELETSQEELQSLNEELQTVNQELKVKIEETGHANNDMRNLMASTDTGTIFLDRSLRVKLFTPRARDIFNLIPADVGRPLLDIASHLESGEVGSEIDAVLETLQPVEREVETRDGRWHLMRIFPYRTADDRIEGAVLTFVDITERRRAAATDVEEQRARSEELEQRVRERTAELERISASRQVLLARIVDVQEEERQRIARELHDEMGQHLTALKVGLEGLGGSAPERIDRLKQVVSRMDEAVDRMTLELRPPALDHLGLGGAIGSLAEDFATNGGPRIDVHTNPADWPRFPEAIESAIFRIAREALTNAIRHSEASDVSVILTQRADSVQLIVEDNGRGFDGDDIPDGSDGSRRFGLLGVRERIALAGGTLNIESRPGGGTSIYVRIPLREGETR